MICPSSLCCNISIRVSKTMLHFMVVVIALLSIFNSRFYVVAASEQDVGSPLRVAQCRAACLAKFSNNEPNAAYTSTCLQGQDCFMCWENCELLQSNFQVWGVKCHEPEICFPGCQQACSFHTEIMKRPQQSQPVIHTKGEAVINVTGTMARWPRPSSVVQTTTPLVYVVMRRSISGPWRQIIQTIDLTTRVPIDSDKPDSTLRVLVVDPNGLVTIYSPYESSLTVKKRKKTINTENMSATSLTAKSSEKWQLVEVSLIYQQFLVISEIAWEPKANRAVYLVTWEVNGGGLRGNLYTDSTSVTLSLWPDTIYHIQVELVSNNSKDTSYHLKSEMLDVDTGKALRVATDSQIGNFLNLYGDNSDKDNLYLEKTELLNRLLTAVEKIHTNNETIWYDVMRSAFDIMVCALIVLVSLAVCVGAFYLVRRKFESDVFTNSMYIEKLNKAIGADILRPIIPETGKTAAATSTVATLPPEVIANILLASGLNTSIVNEKNYSEQRTNSNNHF